jgi:acyl-CoA synthetase (AMP-forming)/AMP-acid ligase II
MILVPQEKIREYVSRGWWGERTIGELFFDRVAAAPTRLAVIDPPNLDAIAGIEPRRVSWLDLAREVDGLLSALGDWGLSRDDVIVVQWPNGVALHALYLACAIKGVVVTPVPVQYRAHELEHIIALTEAKVALVANRVGRFALGQHWFEHRDRFKSLRAMMGLGDPVGSVLEPVQLSLQGGDVGQILSRLRKQHQASGVSAHDVLTICWTSGTEAAPKGVPRNHNEWLIVGRSVIDAGQIADGATLLVPFPFVNMAGISTSLMAWLMTGSTLHHHHPFDLDLFIEQLRQHPTDYSIAAPAVLAMLLKEPHRLEGVDLSRLRRIGSGGAPIADWLVEQFAARFGVELVNYFGSNEGAALASAPQDVPDRSHRARFFPRVGVDGFDWSVSNSRKIRTRLVDCETGAVIHEPGRAGEIRFKGPTIFSGYYKAPELTAAAFDDEGYYCTGDLFEIAGDQCQYYRFVGRKKDIVIRGGMNISAEELEGLLLGHPKVREIAVIGAPDPVLGERVCAVVVPQQAGEDPSLDELVEFLRDTAQVAAYKWPEHIVILDALPRNPVGKVLKRILREAIAQPIATAAGQR